MNDFNYFNDTKFVADEPSASDEFQSGAHARVASTLVNVITSGDGGRAIGLEGTWGSGKSTIIDLARTQFESWNKSNAPKHAIFVFDAWAHQGDPMRRVFLDKLIAELAGKIIDEPKWTKKLEALRSLRKKITEKKSENLSWVARVSLFILPLLPLAYLGLAEWVKPTTTTISVPLLGEVSKGTIAFIGLLIVLSPYIAAFLTWIGRLNDKEMKGKSIIVAFNRQTDEVTTEQLIREDEATTIEFNSVFDELLEDARSRGNRLVIVLDNLDRLANDQIREIWATMRNFFAATPGTERKQTLKNVWLIVPIDRQHIEAVFADGTQSPTDQNARGFVEKTFEILLRVPPPLHSNWEQFFSRKLSEAFGKKISPSETYRIFRLFEIHQTIHPRAITPRAIKSHINKIIGQAKLSGNTVPLEYQALYVLYKNEIAADIRMLQDSTVLDEPIRATVTNPEWTKYVAAAHFSVLPEDALEVLLSAEIEKALLANDTARLTGLAKTGGFTSILHDVLSTKGRIWAIESPSVFFDAVSTIGALNIEDTAAEHIWHDVTECAVAISKSFAATDLSRNGITALISHSRPERKAAIADAIKKALSVQRSDLKDGFEQAGIAWFLMVEALIDASKDIESTHFKNLTSRIPVFPNVEFVLGVAEQASQSTVLSLKSLSVTATPDDLSGALKTLVETAEPPEKLEKITSAFLTAPKLVNWATFVAAIQNRLQRNAPSLKSKAAKMLLLLLNMISKSQKAAEAALKTLNSDGSLHGIIKLGQNEKDLELMATVLDNLIDLRGAAWEGPIEHPQYGPLASVNEFLKKVQTTPDSESSLISTLSQITLDLGGFTQVLDLALPNQKNHEVFRAMLRSMVKNATEDDLKLLTIAENYARITEILGDELTNQLLALIDNLNFEKEFSNAELKAIQPGFLQKLKDIGSAKFIALADVIQSGLEKLTREQWSEVLKAESVELQLLFNLIEWKHVKPLTNSYYDALRANAFELIEGGKAPTKFSSRWSELSEALSESHAPFFYKGIRDHLLNKGPKAEVIVCLLNLLGPQFLKNADLSECSESTIIRMLLDPLLADGNDDGLHCIEVNVSNFSPIISGAEKPEFEFMVGRFSDLLAKADETKKERLTKLAENLGLGSSFAGDVSKESAGKP